MAWVFILRHFIPRKHHNADFFCFRNRPRYQVWKVAVAMLVAALLTFVFVKYQEYAHTGSLELRENFGHSVLVVRSYIHISLPTHFANYLYLSRVHTIASVARNHRPLAGPAIRNARECDLH